MKVCETRCVPQVVGQSVYESEPNTSKLAQGPNYGSQQVSSCSILSNLGDSPSSQFVNLTGFALRNSTLW